MKLREYREGDLQFINHRVDILTTDAIAREVMAGRSLAFTFEADGVPAACVGAIRIFEGVWHVWSVVSDDVRGPSRGLFFFRGVRALLKEFAPLKGISRINAQVDASQEENIRFAQLLGFEQEYLQLNAGPHASGDILGMVLWVEGKNGRRNTKSTGD